MCIKIIEDVEGYSCTIDGIEYRDLINKESEHYNPDFVYKILKIMAKELYKQEEYNIKFTILLGDVLSSIKLENSQWFFERLFNFNKNKVVISSDKGILIKELNIKNE